MKKEVTLEKLEELRADLVNALEALEEMEESISGGKSVSDEAFGMLCTSILSADQHLREAIPNLFEVCLEDAFRRFQVKMPSRHSIWNIYTVDLGKLRFIGEPEGTK